MLNNSEYFSIKAIVEEFTKNFFIVFSEVITPLFFVVLTGWVIYVGILFHFKPNKSAVINFIEKTVLAIVCLAVATSYSNFNYFIKSNIDLFISGLNQLIIAQGGGKDINGIIDNAMNEVWDGMSFSLINLPIKKLIVYLLMLGVMAVTQLLIFLMRTIALININIFYCFAPLAILSIIFDRTRGFFFAWLRNIITYMLWTPLLAVVLLIFSSTIADSLEKTTSQLSNTDLSFLGTLMLFVAMIYVLLQVPTIANHITGGGSQFTGATGIANSAIGTGIAGVGFMAGRGLATFDKVKLGGKLANAGIINPNTGGINFVNTASKILKRKKPIISSSKGNEK